MAPTLKYQYSLADFYPSDKLIELHCSYSRRRSLKRHNRDVLTNARRISARLERLPLPSGLRRPG